MRLVSWVLGLLLGALAGGAALVGGVIALLLLVPAGKWASREQGRPAGLGGLLVGVGAGGAGLLLLANARCAAFNVSASNLVSECVAPGVTPYLVTAAALVAVGIAVSVIAIRSRDARAGPIRPG